MDLTELNLNEEQLKGVTDYVSNSVNTAVTDAVVKAKEGLFSAEDLNKKLQSETDRIRTDYTKKMKTLEDEIVQYKPKDKTPEELAMEQRLKDLTDKENLLKKKEKTLTIQDKLTENNLPKELYKYIDAQDVDVAVGDIKKMLDEFMLNNSYKPTNHQNQKTSITKEDFKRMSYSERVQLSNDNPELFNILNK